MRRLSILLLFISPLLRAQYDPAGGELGSISIKRDHSAIIDWASGIEADTSWQDLRDTSLGKVTAGEPENCLGAADGTVLSLGDGGSATLYFEQAIRNGQGYDLAVFENGFQSGSGYFLELAFVEVSVDGINFTRFPAYSAADTNDQITNADVLQPEHYHNLAGKHQATYGTLFDLDEIGMDSIHYVRVIDVIGIIDPILGSRGHDSVLINDPYPTAFPQGGFDLDAVAAVRGQFIHTNDIQLLTHDIQTLYASGSIEIDLNDQLELLGVYNQEGALISASNKLDLTSGIYYISLNYKDLNFTHKICVY